MRFTYVVKQCLFLPWKILLMRRGQLPRASGLLNRKFILQFLFVAVAVASITGILCVRLFRKTHMPTAITRTGTPYLDCKPWNIKTSQHKSTLITKTTCVRHYFLLIFVSSAPANFGRRNLIRQTWGNDSNVDSQWITFFLIGQTRNQTHSALIKQEEKIYSDIIRGNYFEAYYNQSFKIEMGFEWAVRYCRFSFLLKTDDDVFVRPKQLSLLLQKASTPTKRLYMGKVQDRAFAQRENDSKHFVSYEEYRDVYLPPFCSGGGFVLSYDVVECFVSLFNETSPLRRFDDVYLGLFAKKIGVAAVHHDSFYIPGTVDDSCHFVSYVLLQHRATGQCMNNLHKWHSEFNLGFSFLLRGFKVIMPLLHIFL